MSSRGLALAPPAKNVVVYRNGDPFFHGKKFVVNQRRFLTFEAFLKEVTRSIHAPLAVRNLYTPRHGHRIAELGDLQDGCQYVAAGFEKFKRLNGDQVKMPQESVGRCVCEGLLLGTFLPSHVFRNGDLLSPPFRLLFSQSAPLQWDTLLATLTAKADLRSGAVNRLCRLDGTQVFGEEELVNDGYYVAVGTEEYKKLPYFELLVNASNNCSVSGSSSPHLGTYKDFSGASIRLDHGNLLYPVNFFIFFFLLAEEIVYKAKDPRKEMQGAWGVREHEHTRVEAPTDQV
uniref:Doublecortin domain containing 2B n=1 Tax=Anser brachyrhynchus TaxID=132585 RepID=A0A8B9CVP2_9AVES